MARKGYQEMSKHTGRRFSIYSEVRTNESYEIMVQIDDRRLAEDLNDQASCQAATTACDGIQL